MTEGDEEAIDAALDALLSCKLDSPRIHDEYLSHAFNMYFSSLMQTGYLDCFRRKTKQSDFVLLNCYYKLPIYTCLNNVTYCSRILTEFRRKGHNASYRKSLFKSDEDINKFRDWYKCMGPIYKSNAIKECLAEVDLIAKCEKSKIRAAKIIRGNVKQIHRLAKKHPDWLFIYYVRDPRGIIKSRDANKLFTAKDVIEETRVLCSRMKSDKMSFDQMSAEFPNRVLFLKYEMYAQNPMKTAEETFMFLGSRFPKHVSDTLYIMTHADHTNKIGNMGTYKINSTKAMNAWQDKVTLTEVKKMNEFCRDLYVDLGYSEYGL
ncbi:uncharacterized protein LOC141912832 [Tubulanus polymorphus]|uniref:uncharacterized protein LOC141912832 n=1 Tax=Tubulanus polymorphus TaxID=672921 RepID=UPI003DA5B073